LNFTEGKFISEVYFFVNAQQEVFSLEKYEVKLCGLQKL
jgi:hypothetical protein